MSIWDDPKLKSAGNFVTFVSVGDTVSGKIDRIDRQSFTDSKTGEVSVAPQLFLTCDDGEEKTLTAGQQRLKAQLVELRPEVGDHITVTLTQVEKRGGGKTLKHFDVEVKKGEGIPF
jgi:hypothetical protein